MSTSPGLPPIFAEIPVMEVSARRVAEFPVNTFLESIAATGIENGKVVCLGVGAVGLPLKLQP